MSLANGHKGHRLDVYDAPGGARLVCGCGTWRGPLRARRGAAWRDRGLWDDHVNVASLVGERRPRGCEPSPRNGYQRARRARERAEKARAYGGT